MNAQKWAPGIEIISIRVTKPTIPKQLEQNYIEIEKQKTQLSIAKQQQEVKEQQAETQRREARIKAESSAEIEAIEMRKKVSSKESEKQMEAIENEIYRLRENGRADARR